MSALLRVFDEVPGGGRSVRTALRLVSETVTLRDIVRRRVEQDVADYNTKRPEIFEGLVQPEHSERVLNGFKVKKKRALDAETQVDVALKAFKRNSFIVLFDDRQLEDLDETVTVTPDSSVTFVRLVPLMGG